LSSFTTQLVVKINHKEKRQFEVFIPFKYHVGKYPSREVIEVDVGYKSDFASIPKIFWSILSPIDTYAKAAILHDWLYFKGIYTRRKSDRIFNEAMMVLRTKKWKRITLYFFVRAFGWYRWWSLRKKDKKI
jgi:hypothetical protein